MELRRTDRAPTPPAPLPPPAVTLTYEKVTLTLGDMALHAERIDDRRWRLYAHLNYIVVAPVQWSYEEIVEGDADEVYDHAVIRLEELARLKPIHDAVHDRVRIMSEGGPLNPNRDVVTPLSEASPDNPALLRGGYETTDPRLDRIPQWDLRNEEFRMAAPLAVKEYKPRSYTWSVPVHLDQGNEGSCVGFAWAHELIARPKVVDRVDQPLARWIYKVAQRYDAWSGESYEGTSVLAGAKVIRGRPPTVPEGRGLIDEYRWITTLDEMIRTVGYFGPVVLGIWWWSDMFTPDADGFVTPTGSKAGGHALLVKAVNVKERFFTLHNSWGENWGRGGDCRIRFDDMTSLLADQGECCVPLGRKVLE